MDRNKAYRKIDINAELDARLETDERRREYQATRNALLFGVSCCIRRTQSGFKQKDMVKFGIGAGTMCRIEKGERLPDTKTQPKLTAALQARIIVEPIGEWRLEPLLALEKAA